MNCVYSLMSCTTVCTGLIKPVSTYIQFPHHHLWGSNQCLDWCRLFLLPFGYLKWGIHTFWYQLGMGSWLYFCFRYHSGLYTMRKLSYLGVSTLVSIRFRMVLTQTITRAYKDSLTLTYPPNINIWLVLQVWYPQVGSSIPLLMLIIDTMHSPIYRSNNGSNQAYDNCGTFQLET